MENTVLEVKNLNKSYGRDQVLFGCEFSINKGEIVSIIGPSGAGKSTLLRCLNRMTQPDKGSQIIFMGTDVVGASKKELLEVRKRIGMVFQHYNLVNRLSALENVLHGRLGYYSTFRGVLSLYKRSDLEKAVDLLDMYGLGERKFFRCSDLSGGQKQRVGIARALIQDPALILCDEPIASLDPQASKVIMEHLFQISRRLKIPVLVNLHQVEIAKAYSDRIIGINRGRVVFSGKTDQLTDHHLEEIYGASINEIIA